MRGGACCGTWSRSCRLTPEPQFCAAASRALLDRSMDMKKRVSVELRSRSPAEVSVAPRHRSDESDILTQKTASSTWTKLPRSPCCSVPVGSHRRTGALVRSSGPELWSGALVRSEAAEQRVRLSRCWFFVSGPVLIFCRWNRVWNLHVSD